jgi:GTPase
MNYDVPLRVAVGGNVNAGKCLGINTPILMYDGKIKKVQDVKNGDKVMGDDNEPRTVVGTTTGTNIMYKITMKRGGEYIVNSHHILCLKRTNIECVFIDNKRNAYKCKWWEDLKIKEKRFYWKGNKEKAREAATLYLKDEVPLKSNYSPPNTIVHINVKKYKDLSAYVQKELYGYKVGATFKHQNVSIDPYLLGVWLGDGTSLKPEITNIDNSILEKVRTVCEKNGWRFTKIKNSIHYSITGIGNTVVKTTNKSKIVGVRFSNGYWIASWTDLEHKKQTKAFSVTKYDHEQAKKLAIKTRSENYVKSIYNTSNPFWDLIKKYDLVNNKHIPDVYKYNSRDVQIALLAGMIDTDGHYVKGTYTITQKNKKLLEDLEFICRSLGFWATIKPKFVKKVQRTYYRMTIVGNLNEVPTAVPRKQANPRVSKIGYMVSAIKVEKLGEDNYYGFSVEGNNNRFLLGDFTVTHNSSMLGMLKTGKLDDGNGLIRQSIFNYPHERKTGRTSSVAQRSLTIENKKVIFFDLAGHEKYFRTTLFGISSSYPDVMLVLIESNRGVQQMTKEHIISAIYLRIPIVLVMTKIDIALPKKLNNNIRKIKKMMKNAGKRIYEIREESNIDLAINNLSETLIPLFKISVVKGNDINPPIRYLTQFLNKLNVKQSQIDNEKVLFIIDKSFQTKGYPLIGSGYMMSGKINVNEKLFLGPVNNNYVEITIRSIHDDDRNNVSFIRKNELGCVSIKTKNNVLKHKRQLLPGMIITNVKHPFVKKFMGSVTIFSSHSTTIKVGYNTIIHTGAVRKTVRITRIENKEGKNMECLRGGDKDIDVYFEFLHDAQFIREKDRFIFREGNTRGSGHIVKIIE